MQNLPISKIKANPNNPRIIKDDKFAKLVQSLKDLPEMAKVRPVVVNQDMVVLGGNMRLKAMKEAGWKEAPVEIVDWDEDKQRQFIIKDNVGFGEWDWNMLANEWDNEQLKDWGLDVWQLVLRRPSKLSLSPNITKKPLSWLNFGENKNFTSEAFWWRNLNMKRRSYEVPCLYSKQRKTKQHIQVCRAVHEQAWT